VIVVGIPAHNEEGTIGKVVESARQFVDVVIVCDDGSTDQTSLVASKFGALVNRHSINLGYGRAIRSIFSTARRLGADALVTLDGDSQHDPSSLPQILKPILRNQADVVIGSRFLMPISTTEIPLPRKAGILAISKLVQLLSRAKISDAQCGYRGYNRTAIQLLNPHRRGMGASTELLFDALRFKLRIVEIPVNVHYDGLSTSEKNPILHFVEVLLTTMHSACISS